ncbi:MAG: hypothetical protein M3Z96_01750 [Pseudomonadota bacterium]|nr:hypothetical protein [Pseudomonadota bacterium]
MSARPLPRREPGLISRIGRRPPWPDGASNTAGRNDSPVCETFKGWKVWEGVVHVFELEGHPKATRAYAWSSPIEGSAKRRFFAVLHMGPIKSPLDAVRAAIVAEKKVMELKK